MFVAHKMVRGGIRTFFQKKKSIDLIIADIMMP